MTSYVPWATIAHAMACYVFGLDLLTCLGHPSCQMYHNLYPIIPGHRAEGCDTKRAITSEALRQGRGVSVTFFLLGIFRREKSRGASVEILFHRAIDGGSVSRRVKNRADRAEHSTLIDVSNPDRIVRAEINGTRVKKQNTCLCCRSAHRR